MRIVKKVFITIFGFIFICFAAFIIYCKVAEQIYLRKGPKYEPIYSIYTIKTPSMKPNYNVFDIVINKRVNEIDAIKEGDVITFISTNVDSFDRIMTHRVVGITTGLKNKTCLITKGDNNPWEDSACVSEKNVVGKVIYRIPYLGFLGSIYGIVFFSSIVIAIFFLKKVKKLKVKK